MTLVAVVGDGATTTTVALAAAWPAGERTIVAELDPTGGDLAAWLDVPRSPNLSELVASSDAGSWSAIKSTCHASSRNLDVLVAPVSAVEAHAAVAAAVPTVVPVMAALSDVVVLADGGRITGDLSAVMAAAAVVALVHRQRAGSAVAAAVALERLRHLVDLLELRSVPFVVALVGEKPYRARDVGAFLGTDEVVPLAVDTRAAAVLAGRAGSGLRMRRSPLLRSSARLADRLSARARDERRQADRVAPADSGADGRDG